MSTDPLGRSGSGPDDTGSTMTRTYVGVVVLEVVVLVGLWVFQRYFGG